MSAKTSAAARRKPGRPRADAQLRLIASKFEPAIADAIERIRQHREQQYPGVNFTTSHALREIVKAGLKAPEYADLVKGTEPKETSSPLESDTKKS